MADLETDDEYDALLLLGDNVYPTGDPARLPATVFEPFAEVLDGRAAIVPEGPAHVIRAGLAVGWSLAGGARPVTPMYLRLPDAEVNRRLREGTSS